MVVRVGAVARVRNVIFDWSGTLVDDLAAVLEATNHVLVLAGLAPLSREQFRAEFRLPFTGFYERYTPDVPMAQLETWFHARFQEVQHTVTELPHAREFLHFCRNEGLKTLLLSTVHPQHFAEQTRVNHFDSFLDHPYLGVWDKRAKIHEILTRHDLHPDETLFVGDMAHDIETARHGGVYSVGVLTGYADAGELRRANPDLVVEHLGELQRILTQRRLTMPLELPESGTGVIARAPVITVGAAIFDREERVLMIRTHKWSNLWGIPGGKVKFGETSEEALRRELREETNLQVEDIRFVLVQDCIHSREFYRDEHFVLLNYTCRTGGAPTVQLNEEAQAYQWISLPDALKLDLNTPTRILLESLSRQESN